MQEIEEKRLDVVSAGKDIDIVSNMGEENLMVSEINASQDALIVEGNCMSLEVDIELHVLQEILAHLVYQQHNKLALALHYQVCFGVFEGNCKQFTQERLAMRHCLERRSDLRVTEGKQFTQKLRVLGEDARLGAFAVVPCSEKTASGD